MTGKSICLIVLLFYSLFSNAGDKPFAKWTSTELTLTNGIVTRIVKLPSPSGTFITTSYKPSTGEYGYFEANNVEFRFEFDDRTYAGSGNWTFVNIQSASDSMEGDGAAVTMISDDGNVEVTVQYLLYPHLPVIRKNLIVKNLTGHAVTLESVDIERFTATSYWATTFSWILSDYGRKRSIGPYEGNMQDALLIVHNADWKQGIVIGNEAPGVLKHTSVFWETPEIVSGLTHKESRFPFRKWIGSNESFTTPQVFTMVYNDHKHPDEILNTAVPDFVRKHMGIRLSVLKEKPTFVYNTWQPFKSDINEKLIMELAKAAADAGMKEFVIDDGWQDVYGDWGIDKRKFPNGLKPVVDYIKSLGMKPGLWISIGTASPDSKVFRAHPDWFVTNRDGKNYSIVIDEKDKLTACFGTPWSGYISGILNKLIIEYGLEYLKLDFSIVTSPYRFNPEESGCYSTDHQFHKDHNESLFTNYEHMWKLFDDLHAVNPKVFIDCTFETMGGLQLIDYALLKHAEGDWLSNFSPTEEVCDLRIRNMAWWRSPAMPATALVIGNPAMDDKGWEMHIKSLAGALPIMLGDPRKLSAANLKVYRGYSDWLKRLQRDYDIMSYRQDLPGFGEPNEGMWDGFQRINSDTRNGGLIGVFRHGARDEARQIFIHHLDGSRQYAVKEALTGKIIYKSSGAALAASGFNVRITEKYGGRLFEVVKY